VRRRVARRLGAALALVVGAAGCGGPSVSGAPPAAGPGAAAPGRESGVEVGQRRELGPLAEEVRATFFEVGAVRGLAPRAEVGAEVIDRRGMLERLREKLREEVPAPVVAAQSELLFALGTVPADFDYERSLLEMMEDQLAGFYEPDDRTLYLMSDLRGAERTATLVHELGHALQDQHFGLGERLDYREDANDEQSALHTLAEGDATSVMLEIMQGGSALETSDAALSLMLRGGALLGSGEGVPGIIKRSIVAPYVDGVIAVHGWRRVGGWAAVDALWVRPPRTTEQLLHRERWEADEPAVAVPIPPPPAGGPSSVAYHDVEGEQSLRTLFEEWAPRFKAEAAAAGWAGDRVAVFQDGGACAMAWALRFDDEASAERAAVAFARGVLAGDATGSAPGGGVAESTAARAVAGGETCRERAAAGPFAVVRRGVALAVVAGPYRRSEGEAKTLGNCVGALDWGRSVAEMAAAPP